MSLHANLDPDAIERKRKADRRSSVLSGIISFGVVLLLLLLLSLFLLPNLTQDTPVIVTYQSPAQEEQQPAQKKIRINSPRKPSPPASISRVIVSANASPTSIPVPDVDESIPSVEFGDIEDFGEGWDDAGLSGAGGGGGGFGSGNEGSGGLRGHFYALEHSKKSTATNPEIHRLTTGQYWHRVAEIQSKRFSSTSFGDSFRADKALYLTNLAIPNTPSEQGPSLFGADHIAGKYWIAHYSGIVTAPESGKFRFSGVGDNYLHVLVDGNSVMHYGEAEPHQWDKEIVGSGQFQSPYSNGWLVRNGKWFSLRADQRIRLDIAIGESSGGMCGFLLQWEKEGVNYRKDANGRPILPLFTTAPISEGEISGLRSAFGGYEFDFEKTTVFPVSR